MNIPQLRYFLKTAELLNYTQAADALFITRQSLRQAVAAMEEELGAPLFVNTRNHLALTEHGAYLRIGAEKVVADYDAMMADMKRLSARQIRLRLAFSRSLFPFILPDISIILKTVREQAPDIELDVQTLNHDEAFSSLERGEIDGCCVLQMPQKRSGIAVHRLDCFAVSVDYHESHPLHAFPSVSLQQLCAYPCIGMGSPETSLAPLLKACSDQGLELQYRVVPDTLDAFYMIQHGEAVGFDIDLHGMPGFEHAYSSTLPGFEWELCFLFAKSNPQRTAMEWLCRLFSQAYSRQSFTVE